jgi:TATA-box binding protein (TBP) (component of TFIID and TFIIIB)
MTQLPSNEQFQIVNGTFTGDLNGRLPKLDVLKLLCGFEYDPRRLNAVIIRRLNNKSGTILLFESGRFVIVGVKNLRDATNVAEFLVDMLCDITVDCKLCNLTCKNLVVKTHIHRNFVKKLWNILSGSDRCLLKVLCDKSHMRYVYEPELFPSLKFYVKEPNACVSIFRKGIAIVTGIVECSIVPTIISRIQSLLE